MSVDWKPNEQTEQEKNFEKQEILTYTQHILSGNILTSDSRTDNRNRIIKENMWRNDNITALPWTSCPAEPFWLPPSLGCQWAELGTPHQTNHCQSPVRFSKTRNQSDTRLKKSMTVHQVRCKYRHSLTSQKLEFLPADRTFKAHQCQSGYGNRSWTFSSYFKNNLCHNFPVCSFPVSKLVQPVCLK